MGRQSKDNKQFLLKDSKNLSKYGILIVIKMVVIMYNFDETHIVELKEILNDSLPKEIVAFINTDGGTIFIGITKDKKIVGIKTDIDEVQRKVSDVINDQVSPKSREYVHQHVEVMEGKQVIVIEVKADHTNLYYIKKYGLSEKGVYVRDGSTCRPLSPEEIKKRYEETLNIVEPDITEIESYRQDLTFAHLKNYLISKGNHVNEETFLQNYKLITKNGKYNRMAEILADENDIVVNVMTFKGNDKTEYLKRDEFGYTCILLACEKVLNYVNAINQTFVKVGTVPRIEKKMFDPDAFEQAWVNACVHNKWSMSNHPGVYIYEDRLVIESQGGIPKALTKEQFLKGVSEPVNKALMDIFIKCDFCEESGHGVPTVTKVYGEESYEFSDNFIDVTIPFDKKGFEEDENIQETSKKHPRNIQESVLKLIMNNPQITLKEIMESLNISEGSVRHAIKSLKESGKIEHVGATKKGYWKVNG